jgi:hypothetical protein
MCLAKLKRRTQQFSYGLKFYLQNKKLMRLELKKRDQQQQ